MPGFELGLWLLPVIWACLYYLPSLDSISSSLKKSDDDNEEEERGGVGGGVGIRGGWEE